MSSPSRTSLTTTLRRWYVLALAAVACLSLGAQVLVQALLQRQQSDSRQINLAGRQRMLSQRLCKAALMLVHSPGDETRRTAAEELRTYLPVWRRVQLGLRDGDAELGLLACDSPDVRALLDRLDGPFQAMCRAAAALPTAVDGTEPLTVLLREERPFLREMEAVVLRLDQESAARVLHLQRWELGLLAGTILVLICEAIFIFRPSVLWIDRTVAQLERSQAELAEALHRAEAGGRAKSRFLAQLGHEMRTPLSSCLGLNGLLLSRETDPERRLWLEMSREASEGLLHWMNDLLDLTRIEAGTLAFRERAFDPEAALIQTFRLQAAQAAAKRLPLRVEFDLPPGLRIQGDPHRLRQVAANLVGNAVKFTTHGHVRVRVSLLPKGDGRALLRLETADTGIGIPPERLRAVFEPFEQASSQIQRRFGGTGLGLPIVKEIVEHQGGTIVVDSQPDEGTRFVVEIPYPLAEEFPGGAEVPAGAALPSAEPAPVRGDVRPLSARGTERFPADTVVVAGEQLPLLPVAALVGGSRTDRELLAQYLTGRYEIRELPADAVVQPAGADAQPVAAPAVVAGPPADVCILLGEPGSDAAELGPQAARLGAAGKPVLLLIPALTLGTTLPAAAVERPGTSWGFLPIGPGELLRKLESLTCPQGARADEPPPLLPPLEVLIVEDSPPNRLVLVRWLEEAGLSPLTAETGEQALQMLQERSIDLVLLDLNLPDMDGLEVVRRLRLFGRRFPTCIAVTAHAGPDIRRACLAEGLRDCFAKPLQRAELLRILLDLSGAPSAICDRPDLPSQDPPAAPTRPAYPAEALRRLAGDVGLWRQLAAAFLETVEGSMRQLQDIGDDPAALRLLVHRLGGQIRLIGGDDELAELLARLEESCTIPDFPAMAAALPESRAGLARYRRTVEALLSAEAVAR